MKVASRYCYNGIISDHRARDMCIRTGKIEKSSSTVIVTVTGFSPARFRFHNLIIFKFPFRYLFIQEIIAYLIGYSNACEFPFAILA